MNENVITTQLSNIVSSLIGHTIGLDHIHTDQRGWSYYIPAKSLQEYHPLILSHYRGPLFMVIPLADWTKMEDETLSVREYVDKSIWSFGYYWGGGSMLNGIQWQPLENRTGIHETEKISRYLSILKCRTSRKSSGHMPSNEYCESCSIENCPFSNSESKKAKASWANEVKEEDDRVLLYRAVSKRIEERFGFKSDDCLNQDGNTILMFPSWEKDTVSVYLPEKLLIDMMYNPGKYNIEETANSFEFEIGTSWHFDEKSNIVPSKILPVPADADTQFCYDYWRNENFCIRNWFKTAEPDIDDTTVSVDTSTASEAHNLSLIEKVIKFFKNLF